MLVSFNSRMNNKAIMAKNSKDTGGLSIETIALTTIRIELNNITLNDFMGRIGYLSIESILIPPVF